VVQRFIRYVGKQADGRTVLSTSMSDVEVEEVKLYACSWYSTISPPNPIGRSVGWL